MNGDTHLSRRERRGGKSFQTQALGRAEFAADDGFRHQAALALRRCSASRISGIRSLPKYMSVLSTKMVGEPKPPRAITSSVLALSWSLIACSPMPAKNFDVIDADALADLGQHRILRDVLVAAPIGLEHRARERHHFLPSQMQPRIALTLFTGNTVGGILIASPAERAQSARSFFM